MQNWQYRILLRKAHKNFNCTQIHNCTLKKAKNEGNDQLKPQQITKQNVIKAFEL